MKREWWYSHLLAIPLGALVFGYLLIRANPINFPAIEEKQVLAAQNDGSKTTEASTVLNDTRLKLLRHEHRLRPLSELEAGRKLQELPPGIYGFSGCNERVEAKPAIQSSLEAHKRLDGIAYYVGYASEEDMRKYLARQKQFHIRIFPHAGRNASSVFEIPIYFVAKCEVRSSQDTYYFDLFVTHIPEFQS